jgi:hypothetical protein
MIAHLRIPAIAAVLSIALVGCGMMPRSQSTGAAPAQTAQAQTGYIVPPGYVSGQKIIPYTGRIASKCEHHTSEVARDACIRSEPR